MKRLHVHVAVDDLARSVGFYSRLFAAEPTVLRDDYAKWMLDDPRVNFAISTRGVVPGIEHLGIQVEDPGELAEVYGRLQAAEGPVLEEGQTTCCYAKSEKSWIADPSGIAWEAFLTIGEHTTYGTSAPDVRALAGESRAACCAPDMAAARAESTECCVPGTTTACCGPRA
jgi:catechol 2,3-dioxygenase-like lactoylglutathione lyase family enzyme